MIFANANSAHTKALIREINFCTLVIKCKTHENCTLSILFGYGLMYYIVITIVECDTRKYHEFIAEYCYECFALVTIPKAMNSQ